MSDNYQPEEDDGECHKCKECIPSQCTYQSELDKMLGIFPYRENPDGTYGMGLVNPEERSIAPFEGDEYSPACSVPQPEIIQPVAQEIPVPIMSSGVSPDIQKRRPGGQPGNHNALKHGLYMEGKAIYNTTPIERAQLFDLYSIV